MSRGAGEFEGRIKAGVMGVIGGCSGCGVLGIPPVEMGEVMRGEDCWVTRVRGLGYVTWDISGEAGCRPSGEATGLGRERLRAATGAA